MNLESTAKFFKDARSIWGGVLALIAAVAWGGDQRWQLKDDNEKIISIIEIRQLSQGIDELDVQKSFATDERRKTMLDTLIRLKRNRIQAIKDEKQIQGE